MGQKCLEGCQFVSCISQLCCITNDPLSSVVTDQSWAIGSASCHCLLGIQGEVTASVWDTTILMAGRNYTVVLVFLLRTGMYHFLLHLNGQTDLMAKAVSGKESTVFLLEGPANHLAVGRNVGCSYRKIGSK